MPDRKMFWRIVRRLLEANRGRLIVILLALGAGAAITAALLNLQVDAKRRLTTEFRAFGANIVIAPRENAGAAVQPSILDEELFDKLPIAVSSSNGLRVPRAAFLYAIADALTYSAKSPIRVVVAGRKGEGLTALLGGSLSSLGKISRTESNCEIGKAVSGQLGVNAGERLFLRIQDREESCNVAAILATGGPEDNQVFLNLDVVQRLAALPKRISLIQISYAGTPEAINHYITDLAARLPEADVHGIRQFTEGEAKIYGRISGVLSATVALVLVLTGLCVMAAMTNVAMERKNDVGLMKAIGGATRRVLRLFIAEAAVLGLAGGAIGAACGILLSMWLGKAVFGMAARPRLIVYPVSVALTMLVAILGAYPLKRLASIRPASIFRGEA